MIDWQSFPVTRRVDGSYVIVYNGLPYHVPDSGKWRDLWAEVDAWAQAHPEQVTDEPAPPVPTEEELLEQAKTKKIAVIDAQTSSAITAGFEYEIDPGTGTAESLHFSYDSFDQQNRALREQVQTAQSVEEVQAVEPVIPDMAALAAEITA